MLQALKRAIIIDDSNPLVHQYIVDYILTSNIINNYNEHILILLLVEQVKPVLSDPVNTVISQTIPKLTNNKTIDELNNDFIKDHAHSLAHLISGNYNYNYIIIIIN